MLLLLTLACDPCSGKDDPCVSNDDTQEQVVDTSDPEALAQSAYALLDTHCASCHDHGAIEGGVSYVLDRDRLVETGKVLPGDEGSPLLFRVSNGSMPPSYASTSLTPEEAATLKAWVLAGAPDWDAEEEREFCEFKLMQDRIFVKPIWIFVSSLSAQ